MNEKQRREESSPQVPGRDSGDIRHSLVKAGLGSIPYVGAAASELFSMVVAPPLEKRRVDWLNSIAERLKRLENAVEGMSLDNLSDNQSFISTVMHASQVALRSHQEEKLEALRNAVLNSALPSSPNADLQLMFLNHVDTLTPSHLRILKFFENPREWGEKHGVAYPNWEMGGPANVLEHALPEFRGRREFYDQLVRDLYSRGLMTTDQLHATMTSQGMFASRLTAAGSACLAFISVPKQLDK
jgi:hypothetical protein